MLCVQYEKVEKPTFGEVADGVPFSGPQKGDVDIGKSPQEVVLGKHLQDTCILMHLQAEHISSATEASLSFIPKLRKCTPGIFVLISRGALQCKKATVDAAVVAAIAATVVAAGAAPSGPYTAISSQRAQQRVMPSMTHNMTQLTSLQPTTCRHAVRCRDDDLRVRVAFGRKYVSC